MIDGNRDVSDLKENTTCLCDEEEFKVKTENFPIKSVKHSALLMSRFGVDD